ncbi:MAG: hypothetical protein ACI9BW_000282 [Gammaproteobacteria bacterium]|jgi:hypothetical protein
MNLRTVFPIIALSVGVVLSTLISAGSVVDESGATLLPLLTLLIASEFGFIVTLIGATVSCKLILIDGVNVRDTLLGVGCALACTFFAVQGLRLWPT